MTAYGEPTWPPAGNDPGHHRGDPLTASGEIPVTVDTAPADAPARATACPQAPTGESSPKARCAEGVELRFPRWSTGPSGSDPEARWQVSLAALPMRAQTLR